MSVSCTESSVKHIDQLSHRSYHRVVTNPPSTTLLLAGARKTGSRVAVSDGAEAFVDAEYAPMLRVLTEIIASGHGSRPNRHVQRVTGVRPIRFADLARRTAQARA